jgi:hypothetical protein
LTTLLGRFQRRRLALAILENRLRDERVNADLAIDERCVILISRRFWRARPFPPSHRVEGMLANLH